MAMKGFTRKFKPLELLTEEQLEAIHRGTLDILGNTGIRLEHDRGLELFEKNGCKVDYDEKRVRIPGGLVEECLRKCPTSFRMKARDLKQDLIIGGNTLYFYTFPGMNSVDLDTWKPRQPTRKEFYDAVTVLDALENLHIIGNYAPWFGYEGVPPVMSMPEATAAKLRNSTKTQKEGYSNDCEIFEIQMAQAVGVDMAMTCAASPPLTYYSEAVEAAYRGIEADLPIFLVSGDMMGASAPSTVAGATLTNNAELIAGIVLTQLIKSGAKVVVQNLALPQDMRRGSPAFGDVACSLHTAVFTQYFRRLGIPTNPQSGGPSSSKRTDFQCGYEKTFGALISALCGAQLVGIYGSLYGELSWHPVQAILDDDVAGMIGRFLDGVEVSEETLAIELIAEVGPIPGHYLDKEHTRKWWRKEQLMPRAADRLTYPEWMKQGQKSALDYAKDRMEEILATHKAKPLTAAEEADIERILEDAGKFYRKRGMI